MLIDYFSISLLFQAFTHTDYLEDFAPGEEAGVYGDSAIDPAMKNAFTQTRKWMMAKYSLSEFETWTIITQAVNFGITQLVDGNWGMHALIPKSIFEGVERNPACDAIEESGDIVEENGDIIEESGDIVEESGDVVEESGVGRFSVTLSLVLSSGLLVVAFFN